MNELKTFDHVIFGTLEVRMINGKEYFPATYIATTLGYKNPQKAIRDHCKIKGVNEMITPTSGGNQKVKYINEGNLYRLIARSKLPEAEKFESWVFDEVLPMIRKTGGYVSNEDMFINTYLPYADEQTKVMFRGTLKTVQELNEKLEQKDEIIEEKNEIIQTISDEIPVAEKRKILIRVVAKGGNIQGRYSILYREFNDQYKMNVQLRKKNYNLKNKPKMSSVLEYIDTELNMIPQLYKIAVKLFESDVNKLVEEMYGYRKVN